MGLEEDRVRQGFSYIQALQLWPETDCCLLCNNAEQNIISQTHAYVSALALISSQSSYVMVAGCFDFPKNAFTMPCCTRRSCILTFQILKFFLPLNFLISNLAHWVFATLYFSLPLLFQYPYQVLNYDFRGWLMDIRVKCLGRHFTTGTIFNLQFISYNNVLSH